MRKVVVQDEAALASCCSETFFLDALTGNGLWHNRLKGFGWGLATIATEDTVRAGNASALAEKRRRDEEAGSAAAVSTTTASA